MIVYHLKELERVEEPVSYTQHLMKLVKSLSQDAQVYLLTQLPELLVHSETEVW